VQVEVILKSSLRSLQAATAITSLRVSPSEHTSAHGFTKDTDAAADDDCNQERLSQ
jgi:hypothetical protein